MSSSNNNGFVKRKRNGRALSMFLIYFAAVIIAIFVAGGGSFAPEYNNFIALKISAIFLIPLLYAYHHFQRNLDLLTESEFNSTLFSSSISTKHDFFFFANSAGDIAHNGKGTERYLSSIDYGNCFEALANLANLSHSEKHRMFKAIEESRDEHFYVELKDEKTESVRMCLTITPLKRPHGYFIVQGRKFVAKRREKLTNASNVVDHYDSHNNPARSLINALPFGLYSTSPSGHIRMVNHVLEDWLGYEHGEIIQKGIPLDDLLYITDDSSPSSIEMKEFSGGIKLKHKNASICRIHLTQHVNYDNDKTPTLAVGMAKKL